ncbi:uncharacterized protein LOC135494610 [Lineus longissimus]|uniref:uncharacterized protein LOC135494610 n=1 Tax=Lineus longissimus TaxID=88925 RepID=UPI002B4EED1F
MTLGYVTLDVGDQALIYDVNGRARIEDGPKRIFLFREKYQLLMRFSADQNQYLRVRYRDGKVEHIPGPCSMFRNPLKHQSIENKQGISLDANELVVVYKQDEKSKEVSRSTVYGPTLFTPKSNEWLHDFSWHGTDPENKTRKVPDSLQFTKLQIIPDQFYYNVDEVRTSDDALMRVKLMLFYEIKDVERMLATTQDPIADFINCVQADVIAFASQLSYLEFIEKSSKLNELDNYPQLTSCAKRIGYEVSKVVFRGYFASEKLQKMHDSAIEKRTQLKIQYETEEQNQLLTDMKLQNEVERSELEQTMQLEELKHVHSMQHSKLVHKLALDKQEQENRIKRLGATHVAQLESKRAVNKQTLDEYKRLGDLGLDLNEYILSQHRIPERTVKIVAAEGATNLHLHRN